MTLESLSDKYPTQYGEDPVVQSCPYVRDCSDEKETPQGAALLTFLYALPYATELTPEERQEEVKIAKRLIDAAAARNITVTLAEFGINPTEVDFFRLQYPEGSIGSRIPFRVASAIISSVVQ
ncbi:MAG TPA: hypothetical protein VF733_02755 [Candidatus Saccharimonadales bacterium]